MKKILAGLAAIAMLGLAACGSASDGAAPSKPKAEPETINSLGAKLDCTPKDTEKTLPYTDASAGCDITNSLQVLLMTYTDAEKRGLGLKYVQKNLPNGICSMGDMWIACTTSGDDKTLEPLGGELV